MIIFVYYFTVNYKHCLETVINFTRSIVQVALQDVTGSF